CSMRASGSPRRRMPTSAERPDGSSRAARAAMASSNESSSAASYRQLLWPEGLGSMSVFAHPAEGVQVLQVDFPALVLEQAPLAVAAEQAADRLVGQAEIVADFAAAHRQDETDRRQTAPAITGGEVEQECGEPLLGAFPVVRQVLLLDLDLPAHGVQQLLPQAGDGAGQLFQLSQRDAADQAGFQGYRVAVVVFQAEGIQPRHFPWQVEAGDLFGTVAIEQVGLQRTGAQGVDVLHGLARTKQVLAFVQRAIALDDALQLGDFLLVQHHRQAEPADGTVMAADSGLETGVGGTVGHHSFLPTGKRASGKKF